MRSKLKRMVTAGLTFTVALSAGFVVQYGDALASRLGTDDADVAPATSLGLAQEVSMPIGASFLPAPVLKLSSEPQLTLAVSSDQAVDGPALTAIPAAISIDQSLKIDKIDPLFQVAELTPALTLAPSPPVIETVDCTPGINSGELKLAFVQLNIKAPCHTNMPLTIHHEGMVFSEMTDANGALQVDIPALSQDAFFIVAFDDGSGAITQINVPNFGQYDRSVLQWQGQTGASIHALEFGASYGEDGHISHDDGGSLALAALGESGFLVDLGNSDVQGAFFSQVYTFPSGISSQTGHVVINVEAEILAETCGRDITAQTIRVQGDLNPVIRDLEMTLPDCDAVGEFLVLKNLFKDLTLASR